MTDMQKLVAEFDALIAKDRPGVGSDMRERDIGRRFLRHWPAIKAALSRPAGVGAEAHGIWGGYPVALEIAADILQEVSELPDRTSPPDQPDMMLVSRDELQNIVLAAVSDAMLTAAPPPPAQGWQPIDKLVGHRPVLVSRPTDSQVYTATAAFLDVTGVWRIFRSEGGMTPLPFEPTVFQPLPTPPAVEGE